MLLREQSRKMAKERQYLQPFPIHLAEHLSPPLQGCPGTELLRLPDMSGSLGTRPGHQSVSLIEVLLSVWLWARP